MLKTLEEPSSSIAQDVGLCDMAMLSQHSGSARGFEVTSKGMAWQRIAVSMLTKR
jgi:hypothetical protein